MFGGFSGITKLITGLATLGLAAAPLFMSKKPDTSKQDRLLDEQSRALKQTQEANNRKENAARKEKAARTRAARMSSGSAFGRKTLSLSGERGIVAAEDDAAKLLEK